MKRLPLLIASPLLALAISSPALAAGEASTAVIGHAAGYGAGYNKVINGHAAAQRILEIEGHKVAVFCLQEDVAFNDAVDVDYVASTRSDAKLSNLDKAASIAANSSKLGTPLADKNAEASAVQLAIWKQTNNLAFTAVKNASIVTRANALVAKATAKAEGSNGPVLSAAVASEGDTALVSATLSTVSGKPIAKDYLTLTYGDVTKRVLTNAQGSASWSLDAPKAATKAKITYSGVLPAGSVMIPSSGQIVMTTEDVALTRSAEVTLPPAAVVVTPTTSTPVVTPTTTEPAVVGTVKPTAKPTTTKPTTTKTTPTATTPKELPYTGTWISIPMLLGAAAVAGGGIWYRRRFR